MKGLSFLLLFIALCCTPASADEMVLREGKNEIHLADLPCLHGETMGRIKPELRAQFRKAWAMLDGRYWYACWIPDPDSKAVFLLFEDGDIARLDVARFKYSAGV